MKLENVTIGADIEVFLQDRKNKKIISAEGFIPGTKDNPFKFDDTNPFFYTSLDNVLAEFSIPPAKSIEEFYEAIKKGMKYIESIIPPQLCIAAIPSANLEHKFLMTANAQTFGCEPDWNAYTGFINGSAFMLGAIDPTLRSAGGHIHVGYKNSTMYDKFTYFAQDERCGIIQALDLFLGVPSIIMEPENKRRALYGKAGAFRPKPYGVEYRTLSNFYLENDALINWVYNNTQAAIDFLNNDNKIDEGLAATIQDTINTADKESAQSLINHFDIKVAA